MSSTTARYGASAASTNSDLALLVARILLVAIFPISGFYKVTNVGGTTAFFEKLGAPMPGIAVWIAIFCEFVLPVLVVIGVKARWAAIGLILYTAGTSLIGHRFWEVAPPAQFGQMISFFKNLCMMAGLGLIAAIGPGRYAVQPRD